MLKLTGLLSIAALVASLGFFGGYAASIRSHGDWILMRDANGACAAFDPSRQAIIGHWQAGYDRCHMSSFIWKQIVDRPLRILSGE